MTEKEKAIELCDKYSNLLGLISITNECKQCALIAVDEIIKELEQLAKPEYTIFITRYAIYINGGLSEEAETMDGYEKVHYWQQVKTEIQNL